MDHFDKELQELVAKGKSQRYLTYDEVNRYLPDEEVDPEKLDNLLIALDEQGIELVNKPPEPEFYEAPGPRATLCGDGPAAGASCRASPRRRKARRCRPTRSADGAATRSACI